MATLILIIDHCKIFWSNVFSEKFLSEFIIWGFYPEMNSIIMLMNTIYKLPLHRYYVLTGLVVGLGVEWFGSRSQHMDHYHNKIDTPWTVQKAFYHLANLKLFLFKYYIVFLTHNNFLTGCRQNGVFLLADHTSALNANFINIFTDIIFVSMVISTESTEQLVKV